MPLIRLSELHQQREGESSADIRARVIKTRARQMARQGKANHQLSTSELEKFCLLAPAEKALLEQAVEKLGLSTRAYHRVLKVARTLADMENVEQPGMEQLTEALSYRTLDRQPSP
jgi:magnesium chelatase family protein